MLCVRNMQTKPLQYMSSCICSLCTRNPSTHKRYHKSIVFPAITHTSGSEGVDWKLHEVAVTLLYFAKSGCAMWRCTARLQCQPVSQEHIVHKRTMQKYAHEKCVKRTYVTYTVSKKTDVISAQLNRNEMFRNDGVSK